MVEVAEGLSVVKNAGSFESDEAKWKRSSGILEQSLQCVLVDFSVLYDFVEVGDSLAVLASKTRFLKL